MALFQYIAVKDNSTKKGTINAENQKHARQLLREEGLISSHLKQVTNTSNNKKSLSVIELSLLTRQCAILLTAGMPIEKALAALAEQTEAQYQKLVLTNVRAEIMSGKTFANALRLYQHIFSPIYCSLINAGEESGTLETVMEKLADYNDKSRDLRSKVLLALMYPIILSVVSILVIIALLVYVVPQVVKVFETSKQVLPLITRIMIDLSYVFTHYGIYMLIGIIGIIGFLYRALKIPKNKLLLHKKLLQLPIIGQLLLNSDLARFSNILALLLSSNVEIIASLNASRETVNNLIIKNAIDSSIVMLREGNSLAKSLNMQKIFPSIMIHLISSGEKSGNLDKLLLQIARQQELELNNRSQIFTAVLEPILIVFMGSVVLLIVIAIMLPILNMNQLVMAK